MMWITVKKTEERGLKVFPLISQPPTTITDNSSFYHMYIIFWYLVLQLSPPGSACLSHYIFCPLLATKFSFFFSRLMETYLVANLHYQTLSSYQIETPGGGIRQKKNRLQTDTGGETKGKKRHVHPIFLYRSGPPPVSNSPQSPHSQCLPCWCF